MPDIDVKMQTVPGPGLCSGCWFEAKFQVIPVYITCPFEFRQIFTGVKILESINILGAYTLICHPPLCFSSSCSDSVVKLT